MASALPVLHLPPEKLLMVCSDDDPVVSAAVSKALGERYPASRQMVIAGGGHYPFVLNAADYNREVGAFLGVV